MTSTAAISGVYLLHFEPRFRHAGHYLGYQHEISGSAAVK